MAGNIGGPFRRTNKQALARPALFSAAGASSRCAGRNLVGNRAKRNQNRRWRADDPEPWEEPVEGHRMLADVASLLQKHVVMDDHSVVALALWCVSTYLSDKSILPLQFLGALSP